MIRYIFLLLVFSIDATAMEFPLQQGLDLVGKTRSFSARYEDTFVDIAENQGLGYTELVKANPKIDPWLPRANTEIVLPTRFILPNTSREGIVINLAEFRLYYYHDQSVSTFPIGVGTSEFPSPLIETRVRVKVEKPAWYPPKSIRQQYKEEEGIELPSMVPPGENNPLGPYAIILEQKGYVIHGTNKTFGIGTQVSHGCIRMYNQDISNLVYRVPKKTPVRIINSPVKLGLENNTLYIEIHADDINEEKRLLEIQAIAINKTMQFEEQYTDLEIDPEALKKALKEASGIPVMIGKRTR